MEKLAARLRTAFNERDIDTFRGLLDENARWGDDPDAPTTCHNRAEIVAHLKRLLDEGVRASMVATTTGPSGVACLLRVEWPDSDATPRDAESVAQAYMVIEGRIVEIQGHDDFDAAVAVISS